MRKLVWGLVIAATMLSGCTRIATGEVGLRIDWNNQTETVERVPGSWNQTIVGDILTFPTKDIAVSVENKNPMTADNSALKDFDVTVIYNISPTSVAELYSTKSRAFHAYDEKEKDTLLMYRYIETLINNAAYKAVRGYESLKVADNRQKLEDEIKANITASLVDAKLGEMLTVSQVQIRNIQPNDDIMKSATDFVKAQTDLRIKNTEVQIAIKEAERMKALSENANSSIAYMDAQANMMIAQAILNGKVQTIVVPRDFKGILNVK